MKEARLICIGKIKTGCWREACERYLCLLRNFRKLEITELRDGPTALDPKKRILQEGERVLASLKAGDFAIALSENGKNLSSRQFAGFLRNCDEKAQKRPTFIVGGPYGLSAPVLAAADFCLSLSNMTFPHELARVLALEQIYRAESILRNTPYHH